MDPQEILGAIFLTRPAELEPRQTLTFSRTITEPITSNEGSRPHIYFQAEEEEEFIFAQKPNIKMNKHVNKVRKATGTPVEPRPSQPVANKINNNT